MYLEQYRNSNGLSEGQLFFMYKGGNALKIVYDSVTNELEKKELNLKKANMLIILKDPMLIIILN